MAKTRKPRPPKKLPKRRRKDRTFEYPRRPFVKPKPKGSVEDDRPMPKVRKRRENGPEDKKRVKKDEERKNRAVKKMAKSYSKRGKSRKK